MSDAIEHEVERLALNMIERLWGSTLVPATTMDTLTTTLRSMAAFAAEQERAKKFSANPDDWPYRGETKSARRARLVEKLVLAIIASPKKITGKEGKDSSFEIAIELADLIIKATEGE